MTQSRIVSADSHFLEPLTLWSERLDKKDRDRAPHMAVDRDGIPVLVGEDIKPQPLSGWCGAGQASENLVKVNKLGFDAAPEGVWDPASRLKAQDRDGILAEVLYTSFGMVTMNIRDADFAMACLRIFNDYAAAFCSYDPGRLIGVGAVVPDNIDAAVKELTRIRHLGLRGAMLPVTLEEGESYGTAKYDPIWAAAQDLGLVLTFHAGTSRVGINPRAEEWAQIYMGAHHLIQNMLTDVIVGGVFDRFPKLKFVSAENDVSWLPHYAYRLDHFADRFVELASVRLKLKPSEYIKRNIRAAFQFEGLGVEGVRRELGSEIVLWGNDFPHLDSTWPNSPQVIKDSLEEYLPAKDVDNIVYNNVVALYDLKFTA